MKEFRKPLLGRRQMKTKNLDSLKDLEEHILFLFTIRTTKSEIILNKLDLGYLIFCKIQFKKIFF